MDKLMKFSRKNAKFKFLLRFSLVFLSTYICLLKKFEFNLVTKKMTQYLTSNLFETTSKSDQIADCTFVNI